MKKNSTVSYDKILVILKELNVEFPFYNLGKHLATVMESDPWGMTNEEILAALEKYKIQLEWDKPHPKMDEELDAIIKNGINLTTAEEDDFINGQDY